MLRGVQLYYYKDEPDETRTCAPQGVMRCVAARATAADRRMPDAYAFDVDADTGRTFHMAVTSAPERAAWLRALEAVIQARGGGAT